MSNEIATRSKQSQVIPALQMSENELIEVLQNSVYPGAKLGSIKLVIGACRASGKDPLKKPYHIVPMSVATGKKDNNGWDIKEMRDVIMPGINDYRTDASRTGEHVGTTEPEFGPDVTETLDGVTITYPAWCRVTAKRLCANGIVAEYPAKELWKENYATKSNKSDAPNSMWKKRPYAQLAKCAEAQALRKGFPEVGNQPTADEMEGKEIDMGAADVVTDPKKPAALPAYSADQFEVDLPGMTKQIKAGKRTPDFFIGMLSQTYTLTPEQKAEITALAVPVHVDNDGVIDAEFVKSMEGAAA